MKVRRTTWLDGENLENHVAVLHLTHEEIEFLIIGLYDAKKSGLYEVTSLISQLNDLLMEVDGK